MSDNIFINRIEIANVRNLKKKIIDFNTESCKHFIITGANGSGKTTLLNSIYNTLTVIIRNNFSPNFMGEVDKNSDIKLGFVNNSTDISKFFGSMFGANRKSSMLIPDGVVKLEKKMGNHNQNLSSHFIQYIVHLKTQAAYANLEKNTEYLNDINNWFDNFENSLKYIYDEPDLKMIYEPTIYNFKILIKDKEPFTFTQLSDGYSAIINIISELIIKMSFLNGDFDFYANGIVFIDEIETHLHLELQQKILRFLCDFFPNIQFIVTTHSPFVLSSIENAVIYDLENDILTEDLSGYPYDAIIESYFEVNKYSKIITDKINRFIELGKSDLEENLCEYTKLKKELLTLPKFLCPDIDILLMKAELNEGNF